MLLIAPVVALLSCGQDASQELLPLNPATVDSTTAVYFASNRSGHFEIYQFVLTDTLPTRITRDPRYDSWWPRVSPASGMVTFYRSPAKNKDNNYAEAELWRINASGSNPVRLIALADHNWGAQGVANWSPDGRSIVMTAMEKGGRWNIYIADSLGRNPVRVNKRDGFYIDPSFSPDGGRIVCAAFPNGAVGTDLSQLEIMTMNIDGTNEQRLTNDSLRDHDPVWSPDGTEIAFETEVDTAFLGAGKWALRAVRPDGTVRTIINDGNINTAPRWTSRSSQLYFHRFVFGGEQFRIGRITRDGRTMDKITFGLGAHDDVDAEPIIRK